MKKRLLMLICILCTMAIFVGGTLAYFTDSVTATAEIKSAMIDIEQIEMERQVNKESLQDYSHDENNPIYLYPAVYSGNLETKDELKWSYDNSVLQKKQEFTLNFWSNVENAVDKIVFVKNSSTTEAAFRTIYAFEAYTGFVPSKLLLNRNEENYTWTSLEGESLGNINGQTYYFLVATYNGILEKGEVAPPSLLQVALSKDAGNKDLEMFGDTYEILVVTQATQANYNAPENMFSSDPNNVFSTDPKEIVAAVVNKYYKPANLDSPIYPPNVSSSNDSSVNEEG